MEQILSRPLNWAENAGARFEKSHPSRPVRILNEAFFLLVAEAFTYLAMAYHAASLVVKALPMTARHILLHTPYVKAQLLGIKIPEWVTWNTIKQTHAKPLEQSVFFSPLVRSYTQTPRAVFVEMEQKMLYHPEPLSMRRRIWNAVSSRPYISTLTLLGIVATGMMWIRYQNAHLAQQCELKGDQWKQFGTILDLIVGSGYCSTMRRYYREQKAECKKDGGDWLPYTFSNDYEAGRCDFTHKEKADCKRQGGEWNGWGCPKPSPAPKQTNAWDCPAVTDNYPHLNNACASNEPSKLGVFGTDDEKIIRKKMRQYSLSIHPDKNPKHPDCVHYWQCITSAVDKPFKARNS